MNITDFEKIPVIGPNDWVDRGHDVGYYDAPPLKYEFYTTKYAEYDYSVPMSDPNQLHVELGVFRGMSIRYMSKNWSDRHWYGFDTFEGVDEIWELGGGNIDMRNFKTELPEVPDNVTLVQGLFHDTLYDWKDEHKGETISYLNMDADIYSSTKQGLTILNDLIIRNTIIRFDELSDWRVMNYEQGDKIKALAPDTKYTRWREGEWKALVEWIEENDREVKPLWRNWHQSAGVLVVK